MPRTPRPYYTYEETKKKIQDIGISSRTEYRDYTKSDVYDSMIPTDPQRVYESVWEGWPVFCGKSQYAAKYLTYERASAVAQALGISTKQEYEKRYTEDSGLPCAPHKVYNGEWKSWTRFLGGVDAYETLKEASKSARELKIRTKREYGERRGSDPRLPSNPDKAYHAEWTGWDDFLGKMG